MTAERILVFLLRLKAVALGSAVFAVFLPSAWMDAIHRSLGLGPLPDDAVVGYMARSLSALYASHGALALLTSLDVRRFLPFVKYQGWFAVALGALILGIDVVEQMPLWWTAMEAPPVMAAGVLILALARRVAHQTGPSGCCS